MPRKNNGARVASEQIAKDWLELGVKPVPIWPGQKKPKGTSWQKLRVTPRTIADHFKSGDNVGGLWGSPSNWIVDVDLDDEYAADVAEFLMPRTITFGRTSRPDTHLLYICKGAKTQKWRRGKNRDQTIVELRSTGSQTVLPPSVHPDNERYEVNDWNSEEFTAIPRLKLLHLLDELAAAALFARYYPEDGSRHDYVHAMAGAMLYSKLKPEDVRRVCKAIIWACSHKEDDVNQRLRTVENTIQKHKEGERINGWPTLKDWVEAKDIQLMRKWITHRDFSEEIPKDTVVVPTHRGMPDFDLKLLEVPGLVGDIVKWSSKETYLEQPSFDLATALMCVALASCNHYEVDNWDTPLQPYFMLLAPTAAGKGASLDRVFEFAKQIKLQDYVYQHFQSYHAMMDRLSESPHIVCWLWDEAARHLRTARSASSQDFQIISHLISLYGRANKYVPGVPGRKNPIPPLDNPFLTLFATAQPTRLVESISTADLATGFVNRFILFDAGDKVPRRNPRRDHVFPSRIKQAAKAIVSHEPRGGRTRILFDDAQTFALFDDFAEQCRIRIKSSEQNEVWGRANQNALLVAGIVAVGVDPKKPKITAEIAAWAIRLVSWSIESWAQRVEDLSTSTFRETHSKKVEMLIRNPKGLITRRTRANQKALLSKGLVPKSVLTSKLRALSSRDIEDILDQLITIGLVGTNEQEDGTVVYWPKR
ncbi:bifunctional DNA primase/polymerase [[Eubacterium] cellulosolvens]